MTPKTVALIGTLDTKGEEFAFLRDWIESCGLRTLPQWPRRPMKISGR
jgi:uncharacterized protein (UPF0261 family)